MIDSYILFMYLLVVFASVAGAFSANYDGNSIQRLSLFLLALWSVWRMWLVWEFGWGFPHEWLLATALVTYAGGTVKKTLAWRGK